VAIQRAASGSAQNGAESRGQCTAWRLHRIGQVQRHGYFLSSQHTAKADLKVRLYDKLRRVRRSPESVKYALDTNIFIDSFHSEEAQAELVAFRQRIALHRPVDAFDVV